VMTAVYLLFALIFMDPADSVRYALPSLPGILLFALLAIDALLVLTRGLVLDWIVVVVYGIGTFIYTAPALEQRATSPSPPVAAAEYIRRVAPKNSIILFDLAIRPQAEYLLRGYTRLRIDEGLLRFGHRTDVPIYQLIDGDASREGAVVFSWPESDAYAKMTRQHYRVVSVLPMPPEQRFQTVSGIWAPERAQLESWRWVSRNGLIVLPDLGATRVKLTFVLPPEHPFDSNTVTVTTDLGSVTAEVGRNKPVDVVVPIPPGRARVHIAAAREVVPGELPGSANRDTRHLAVMLRGLVQVDPSQNGEHGNQK
ncbi:MAG: hypothetical protein JWO56_869, partial [Acidobacteria bacterium]|nr:hypothetical protein [Acidobacteriota bacterium]